jgi:hypothetical protein
MARPHLLGIDIAAGLAEADRGKTDHRASPSTISSTPAPANNDRSSCYTHSDLRIDPGPNVRQPVAELTNSFHQSFRVTNVTVGSLKERLGVPHLNLIEVILQTFRHNLNI